MAAAAALLFNFIALSLIISISPSVSSSNILSPNQTLADNQTLVSSDARFALGFFSPPGSTKRYIGVWYNTVTVQTVFWVANRAAPVNDSTGILSLTPAGTLIVTTTAAAAAPLWSSTPSSAAALTSPTAKLLDNGNLVVADGNGNGNIAWQSFDHPTDTLVSGMKLGVDFKKGINRTFAAWTSASDPAPGPITAFMDVNGDPEILMFRGSTKIWRTGPWDGHHLSGVPETSTYRSVNFTFIDNEDETGQDLYVRVAAADLGSTNKKSRKSNVVVAIATTINVLGIILLMVLAYLFWLNKRKRTVQGFSAPATEQYNDESREGNDLELPLFDLDNIASSTDNFSMAHYKKLGYV